MTDTFSGADNSNTPTTTATPVAISTPAANVDVEKLNKRINDSQEFISQLKTEKAAQDQRLRDLEELVKKLQAKDDILDQINNPVKDTPKTDADIAETLRRMGVVTQDDLQQLEIKKVQAANYTKVLTVAKQLHGDKVDEYISTKCTELGVNLDWAVQQAKTAPAAFLKMFDLKASKQTSDTPMNPSFKSAAFHDTKQEPVHKPLFGATQQDLLNSWRAAKIAVDASNQ